MKLYIVRHTSLVVDGAHVCYGATDVNVAPTFYAEADRTKAQLQGLHFDAVYTSPLSRAVKLATYCGYPQAEPDPRLAEMNFGQWELQPWEDLIPEGADTAEFFLHYVEHPTPGGESQRMHLERVRHFIEEKKREGKEQILAFCHGGTINCARTLTGACRLEEAFALIPDFGSVTVLEF